MGRLPHGLVFVNRYAKTTTMSTKYTIHAVFAMMCISLFVACEKGNGVIVTQTFDLPQFEKVNFIRHADVYITQGLPQQVTIEGEENLMDLIKTDVVDGRWTFDFKKTVSEYERMTIRITMPLISAIEATEGSGSDIYFEQTINTDSLVLTMNGDGSITGDVDVVFGLTTHTIGSGNMTLSGSASLLNATHGSAGMLSAYDLMAGGGAISVDGAGDAQVNYTGNWSASISGAGNIYYKGLDPTDTTITSTGTGEVVAVP